MQRIVRSAVIVLGALGISAQGMAMAKAARRLSIQEYRDKMKAGWIGQMAGVGWGGPTEFKSLREIISE